MIAWIGPRDGCFHWFIGQIECLAGQSISEFDNADQFSGAGDCDRIIVAVRNRLDYPRDLVRRLQSSSLEIPWAMVVDNWWDGSRRTGIGNPGHIIWPWYRWWDGWFSWLCPDRSQLTSHPAQLFEPVTLSSDVHQALVASYGLKLGTAQLRAGGGMLILSGCAVTASTWRICARTIGLTTTLVANIDALMSKVQAGELAQRPAWILVDDSAFLDHPAEHLVIQLQHAVRLCLRSFPDAHLILAASLPQWSDWRHGLDAGARDLIAKPSNGLALCQCVTIRGQQDTSRQTPDFHAD